MRDNRSMVIIAIILACILIMMITIVASAGNGIQTSARSAVLYEPSTGTFIYEKSPDIRLPMASTTKIMTALLAIECCNTDDIVEIPKEAVGIEGSSVYLSEGDTLSVKDLIYALMLQSANDAATALAIKISGDTAEFAQLMNRKARSIGAQSTSFVNPHGLNDDDHYTTARDLAIITAEAMKSPFFKQVVSTYKYSFSISGKPRTVVNHNKMLRMYDGAIGVKTGYTSDSGRCLVSAAERNGIPLIAVTLDAPDDWRDHCTMLDYGFSELTRTPISELTKLEFNIPVIGSEAESIRASIENADDILLVKRRSDPSFSCTVDVKQYAVAPISIGDCVGEVIFRKGDEVIMRSPIIATTEAKLEQKKKFNLFDIFNFGR